MTTKTIRFGNGREAGEYELELIARAFGFSSLAHMQRVFVEHDRKRGAGSRDGRSE